MIKAVVFDMDGVLIDAKEWHYEALNSALEHFGFSISRSQHLEEYDGLPTKVKLEMLTDREGFPRNLQSFVNELKQDLTYEIIQQKCRPTFQHQYALSRLTARGLLVGVASNSIADTVELMMRRAALDTYLDVSLSASDVVNPKPDPEIYLKAIAQLGIDPSETLVVEDNMHGVQAAVAAGAHVLKVENVTDVNIENILGKISELEGEK